MNFNSQERRTVTIEDKREYDESRVDWKRSLAPCSPERPRYTGHSHTWEAGYHGRTHEIPDTGKSAIKPKAQQTKTRSSSDISDASS